MPVHAMSCAIGSSKLCPMPGKASTTGGRPSRLSIRTSRRVCSKSTRLSSRPCTSISGNVSALTSLFAATLGSPVVKVAAFSYGVRQAASKRSAKDIEKRVKTEIKAEKKAAKPKKVSKA